MVNILHQQEKFEEILSQYRISDENKDMLAKTQLVLLTGASSTGRNTLIRELEKTGEYHFIVSDTTRKPRMNDGVMEQDGVEYWFKSESDFLNGLQAGDYLEAEVIHDQQVSGMSMQEIRQAAEEQKIAITDIDIGGIQNVIDAKPDTLPIVMLPPNFEEWQHRIQTRGEMSETELMNRMYTAMTIFEHAAQSKNLYFLISEDVQISAQKVQAMVGSDTAAKAEQAAGRQLAHTLYIQTKQFIHN